MSFVFYDTETTGTDTAFDQILQFAAVKTDSDLNEIDRFEIRCRLMPHIVPAPGAMRVTGVTVAQMLSAEHCSHYDMIRKIRAKMLEWSPSVIIGYNSLDYDEHILRQALYKTLHPPYLTNTGGNCRADALRMVRAASLHAPGTLVIPTDDAGKNVFKLDRIAPLNGFDHASAHDALADVHATIFLCRLIQERAPDIWSTAMRFSQKAAVAAYIEEERIFCMSEFYFGQGYAWIVTPIGTNSGNGSEFYVYDLQVDPGSLASMTDDELAFRLARSPKPLRRLRSNGCPMIVPIDEAPDCAAAARLPRDELERRAHVLHIDEPLRSRLIEAFEAGQAEKAQSPFIEKQIYDGFWPRSDEALMDRFHAAPWEQRPAIAEAFSDPRLKVIAMQLIHTERPDLLSEAIRAEQDVRRARRVLGLDDDVPWLTLPKALADIEAMLTGCEDRHRLLLEEHRAHLNRWHGLMMAIIPSANAA